MLSIYSKPVNHLAPKNIFTQKHPQNHNPHPYTPQTFGHKKSPWSAFAIISLLLLPLLTQAQSFLNKNTYDDHAKIQTTDYPVNETNISKIIKALPKSDFPNKLIMDGNNPPINEVDYNEINKILADGNTVIITLNHTSNGVTDPLVKTIFDTYFSGVQATKLKDKLVITIDANRFKQNQPNKINFASIEGFQWNSEIDAFRQAIQEQVLPNLDRASRIGGEASKESVGRAIKVIAELTQKHFKETNNTGTIITGIFAILGLLGLTAGGIKISQLKRSRKEVVQQVKETLELAKSDYKVGTFNVFKPSTLNALLDISPQDGNLEESLITSLNQVTPNLMKKYRPKVYNALVSSKGLYHNSAYIRQWVVSRLANTDGFIDRRGELENYYELTELLRQEKSGMVQEALVKALLPHAEQDDIDFLSNELKESDGLELFMLHLYKKFPTAEYVDNFLTQLETEERPVLRNSLITLSHQLIQQYPEKAPQLLRYIQSGTAPDFRKMAVETLGQTQNSEFFHPLLEEYLGETNSAHQQLFITPLQQTLNETHEQETLYPILQGTVQNIPVERLLWEIVTPKPAHVEPLIQYLELPHTRFAKQAIELLANSVNSSHSERLQDILRQYEQTVTTDNENHVTDYEPVLGAISGLSRLEDKDALNELFELLDNPELEFAHAKVLEACERMPNDTVNYDYLKKQLETNPSEASKIAAIALLDNYGSQALPLLLETYSKNEQNDAIQVAAEQSILRIARDNETCYTPLLEAANDNHNAAEKAVLEYYAQWQHQHNYDDITYRHYLKEASTKSTNKSVQSTAKTIYTTWVNQKANECEAMGQDTSVTRDQDYTHAITSLLTYRNAEESIIQDNANKGLTTLVTRLGSSADVDSSSDYNNAHDAISTVESHTNNEVKNAAEKARRQLEKRRNDYLEEQERLRQEAAQRQKELMKQLAKSTTNNNGYSTTTSSSGYRSSSRASGSGSGGGYGTKSWGAM